MAAIRSALLALLIAVPLPAGAHLLPGLHLEEKVTPFGFVTSITFDHDGRLLYSVTDGRIYRVEKDGGRRLIASIETASEGNAALLGIVVLPDGMIATHHVSPDLIADVVALVDPDSGEVTELARFVCDQGRVCSTEHHGGNPVAAPDGSIFVPIGDFGGRINAQSPDSPAGKIFRVGRDGSVSMFAIGFRNVFDLAVAADGVTLIVPDNGAVGDDEVNLIREGDNAGWPFTAGNNPPVGGTVAPSYVFHETVAPTGTARLRRQLWLPRDSIVVGTFVTGSVVLFPDAAGGRFDNPIEIFRHLGHSDHASRGLRTMHDPEPGVYGVVDLAQAPDGSIWVAAPLMIYRLELPKPGDVDGDGDLDDDDAEMLARELTENAGGFVWSLHEGAVASSWGADVNLDGVVDSRDLVELNRLRSSRTRAVRRGGD